MQIQPSLRKKQLLRYRLRIEDTKSEENLMKSVKIDLICLCLEIVERNFLDIFFLFFRYYKMRLIILDKNKKYRKKIWFNKVIIKVNINSNYIFLYFSPVIEILLLWTHDRIIVIIIVYFIKIKKSSSEEKQNTQKVAELLSMSTSQCNRSLNKSLNPIKVSNNVTINQSKNAWHYI